MSQKKKKRGKRKTKLLKPQYYDYNLLASVILLTCFGLIMLYSTSAYRAQMDFGNDMFYFRKQAAISAVCLVGLLFFSQVDYHYYAKLAPFLYVVANILLFLTKFIGRNIKGATRWIYIGPISFQPAELGKLAIILMMPVVIVKMGKNMKGIKAPCIVGGFGALTSFLTFVFTDNLSTAIIIAGITAILILVSHPTAQKWVLPGIAALAVAILGIRSYVASIGATDDFRFNRILVWINPEAYASRGGYQIMQALYAIGSGGFFGKGLGNSAQKLEAVPEAQNDMIFSIVCEELGIFGAAMLTIMFVFLLYRLMFIAQNAPDLLGSLIATGIFSHIALQVVLNIAVVINLIPTTGITLPFVSYGGTSIVFLMAEMTLALSVSSQIKFRETNAVSGSQKDHELQQLRKRRKG
ncbi:MAG: FtsW/RodA/SpoVE family cell cycle protein [Blautia sp.]|nr:FtsW/RodA/SpoVE family cell cycle protein [Blautia sp.]MDY4515986.1 FtsW/RodA/SpoVE family cell cycle protein [Lachnospiraceae bacterium]